jgi:hypothetical protein
VTGLAITPSVSLDGSVTNLSGGRRMYQAFDGFVSFGVTSPPPDICNLYAKEFNSDSTTTFEKGWFAILMGAKLSGKQIDAWYTPSGNGQYLWSGAHYAVVTALGLTCPPWITGELRAVYPECRHTRHECEYRGNGVGTSLPLMAVCAASKSSVCQPHYRKECAWHRFVSG